MKKLFSTLLLVLVFAVPQVSTALVLNVQQQQQMSVIMRDLMQILGEIDAAAAQGNGYLNSIAFSAQSQSISVRIRNIQAQIMSIFASITPTNPYGGYTPTTPYQPTNPTPYVHPYVQPTTPQVGYSTATIRTITAGDSPPNVATFSINAQPNAQCSALQFTLDFGDGQSQSINFPASCGNQIQTIQHAFPNTGTFTVRLSSGSFATTLSITTPITSANGGTVTLNQAQGAQSYQVAITVNAYPGSSCGSMQFTLDFGDTQKQSLSFPSGCSSQVQTVNHTYSGAGPFTVKVTDNTDKGPSMVVYPQLVIAAGVGDPQTLFQFLRSGAGALADTSVYNHSVTNSGVVLDPTVITVGTTSARFSGSSQLSIPGGSILNLGSGDFTITGRFIAKGFPASGMQSGVAVQANAGAADSSLGGAGLELYNNGVNTQIAYVGSVGGTVRHPIYTNTLLSGPLALNTGYHVAVVRSGSLLSMYINGTVTATTTISGAANNSSAAFTLGRYGEYNGNYFNGLLSDFRLVKRALWTNNFDATTGVQTTATTPPVTTCSKGGIGFGGNAIGNCN